MEPLQSSLHLYLAMIKTSVCPGAKDAGRGL